MSSYDQTCWTLIHDAARGDAGARELFVRRYLPCVRAYLFARWKGGSLEGDVDDAVQEVFLNCFRAGGALEQLEPDRSSGFRAYLYGVTRNAARHAETHRARESKRRTPNSFHPESMPRREEALSKAFDRAWAQSVLGEAMALLTARAVHEGATASRRVELLRLRFEAGVPIRDLARRWGDDPARLHTEYGKARREFVGVLREVMGLGESCPPERVKDECQHLLALLERK